MTILLLKNISLYNFKNYEDSFFSFEPQGCLITGENGVGKTNLLEAISYFTYGKSILNNNDQNLIKYTKDDFQLKSHFVLNDYSTEFKVYYNKQKKKIIQVDNNILKKISDLYKLIQVVYSGPDDIFCIYSTPIRRRQFLDMAISKIYPTYIDSLREFKNTLIQRNALLKTDYHITEKSAWDKSFVEAAINVINFRTQFFTDFNPIFRQVYQLIVENEEKIDIKLRLNFYEANNIFSKFIEVLSKSEEKEKRYQSTLYGPHLDDFEISINDKNSLYNASQGQKRSIVIALKLALAKIIFKINMIKPLLIFDDTLSDLDCKRSNNLLSNLLSEHQIFIATPTVNKYLSARLPLLQL